MAEFVVNTAEPLKISVLCGWKFGVIYDCSAAPCLITVILQLVKNLGVKEIGQIFYIGSRIIGFHFIRPFILR